MLSSSSSSSSRSSTPDSTGISAAFDERKPIDKNLPPTVGVNLLGWLELWQRLNESGDIENRDSFAHTGHFTDPATGMRQRAKIVLDGYRPTMSDVIHQVSNIDSVIGVMLRDIPVIANIVVKYHILLNQLYTLKTDLHIPPIRVEQDDGSFKLVHMHKVPNTRLLKLGADGLVRIFFPFLELPGGNVCMDEDHMRELYDLAMHPAAVEVLPEDLHLEWPPKYDNEDYRARIRKTQTDQEGDARGQRRQHSERDIHAQYLNPWLERARQIIATTPELRWARGFFLGFEMRGTKNRQAGMHMPPSHPLANEDGEITQDHPRIDAVENTLQMFDTGEFEENCWFIDIATRITISEDDDDPSACTFLDASKLPHIIDHFTSLGWGDCVRFVAGHGNHFQKDQVAHLNDISGGRLVNPRWAEDGVVYLQIYTSDKSVTYNVELAHKAQRTSARQIIKAPDSEDSQHFIPLIMAFKDSAASKGVSLRIESRVEFYHYPNCHLQIPEDLLRCCLFHIPPHHFWGWKISRLLSIRSVINIWIERRKTFTSDRLPEVGTLLILLEYMANALVNRPDSGGTWDQVHDAGCVHAMIEGQLVASRPLGAFFIPVIHFHQNKQPRASSQRTLSIQTICYLLGSRTDVVTQAIAYSRIVDARAKSKRPLEDDPRPWENSGAPTGAPRHANKQRRVTIRSAQQAEDHFADLVRVPERERYDSEEEDPEQREETEVPSRLLAQVVYNYPIQIMAKAPNRAGSSESWCSLTARERSEVNFEFFGSRARLDKAFKNYILYPADTEKWDRTVELLFPDHILYLATYDKQGLKALGVRHDFVGFMGTVEEGDKQKLLAAVRALVSRSWAWLPFGAAKGHLWATGKKPTKGTTQVGDQIGGPYIILNPAFEE